MTSLAKCKVKSEATSLQRLRLQMEINLDVVHVTTSTFSLAVSFGDLRPVSPMPGGARTMQPDLQQAIHTAFCTAATGEIAIVTSGKPINMV